MALVKLCLGIDAAQLLLPGALLVPMGAHFLAPFVPIDFCLPTFFQ
jgi:hypothetical protein